MKDLKHIMDYYETYDEDNRLARDNAHKIEYLTTMHYLSQIIKPGDKILDIGAGTGVYSLYFAEKGHQVTAIELAPKNIEIMKTKVKKNHNITIFQGDARDLTMLIDDYDVVLCFGPLYHLQNAEDKNKCIYESLRVAKPNGNIIYSYISSYMAFINSVKNDTTYSSKDTIHQIIDQGSGIHNAFCFMTPQEMESLIMPYSMKKSHHIACDGISYLLQEQINKMTDEEFNAWKEYHFKTCEDPNLLGYSMHNLVICQKY